MRRGLLTVGALLLLSLIIGTHLTVQKDRFIKRLEKSNAYVHTDNGWLRKILSEKWQTRLATMTGIDWVNALEPIDEIGLRSSIKFTEEDWMDLKYLTRLELLDLGSIAINDGDLRHLANMTDLKLLSLQGCNEITDAGLIHLREMKKLNRLEISFTKVSDEGLVHLEELKNLNRLDLQGTRITQEGLLRIQSVLPNCRISY